MTSSLPIDVNRPARVLLWVMIVAVPTFGLVVAAVEPGHVTGLWWRGALSGIALLLVWGERRSEAVRRHLRRSSVVVALVLYAIFQLRAVQMGLPAGAVVSLMLIQALTASVLTSVREVVAFLGVALLGAWLADGQVAEPAMALPLVWLLSTTLVLGMGLVTVGRARAEQALREARQELEERVHERTEALQREVAERKAAELQAKMADRAKSRFLANMSHELRTPLNAVTGYSEMVREELEGSDNDELVGDLDRVLGAAGRLTDMIDDLLDLARIEAGAIALRKETVRLDHVVAEVARLLEPLRARSGARLELHVPPLQAHTDQRQLEQIVLQLVSNALTHAPGGSVVVRAEGSVDRLLLEVHDDGVGIEAEHLERIFERFAQVDDSSTRRVGGAGLGLALCRDRAHRLGGAVGVRSVPGEGSTFWVTLPGPWEAPLGLPRTLVDRSAGATF